MVCQPISLRACCQTKSSSSSQCHPQSCWVWFLLIRKEISCFCLSASSGPFSSIDNTECCQTSVQTAVSPEVSGLQHSAVEEALGTSSASPARLPGAAPATGASVLTSAKPASSLCTQCIVPFIVYQGKNCYITIMPDFSLTLRQAGGCGSAINLEEIII